MYDGDQVGADKSLGKMQQLGGGDPRFGPAALREDLVADGGEFTEINTGGLKTGNR